MDSSPTIALAIIAKDEIRELNVIFKRYCRYFDEIHVAIDCDMQDAVNELTSDGWIVDGSDCIHLHHYEWCDDFAHKRNFLTSKIDTDYYFRLDTDDTIKNPENIRAFVNKMKETDTDVALCLYEYNKDQDGNVTAAHYRETIIKNDEKLYWNKAVHENVICDNAANIRLYRDEDEWIVIEHHCDLDHIHKSLKRNFDILIKEYEEDTKNADPRTLAYLGRTLLTMGRVDEAVILLDEHIKKSGWDEDRYISYLYLAECLTVKEDLKGAMMTALMAVNELPDFPSAYAKLAELHFNNGSFEKCIEYGKVALSKPQPGTNLLFDPSLISTQLPLVMAHAYLQINDIENAASCFKVAQKNAPNQESIIKTAPVIQRALEEYHYMEHLIYLIKYTKENDKDKLEALIESIPESLNGNDMIMDLRHRYCKAKTWADNSVVIFCSNTPHVWSPLETKTGIGGSEEATIHLSAALVKQGYEVTVFGRFIDDVELDGVRYVPQHKFNRRDTFSTIVWWRQNPSATGIDAKRQVMWIHDLPSDSMLTHKAIENLDCIVVLSEYHKSLLPKHVIESGKVVVSTNGINPADFDGLEDIEKKDNSIIYASSYDRGLELIVSNWEMIRAEIPDAELHIYYGWNTYDDYVRMGMASEEFKTKMVEYFKQDGIFEHGRVGHRSLAEAYAGSVLFAYPSCYKGEINCIALTKAMASNCNIITNDFAVLGERSPNAVTTPLFIEELIETLRKDKKEGLNTDYIDSMSWNKVASQWIKEII